MNIQKKLHLWGNSLGLLFICIILIFAFADQLLKNSLPCPLCLLQRICFAGVGLCLMMNLRLGIRMPHYGFMLLQALLGLAVATRQIYLHLEPGTPGYGDPFLGLYFYTWSAVIFLFIIGFIAIALLFEHGIDDQFKTSNKWLIALMYLFLILILANGISTFIECGPYVCPDNPTVYYFFK
ncbi:disulfide bond formation protein B [Legionella bononiensis]|uniref:Disulfide bond formation protein B n=1 Tax=Legionella bononiensis TaxID=2793102 RepID=A0ABS1W977_9GAMM|nr:disulfide bond formation protein B [Legionella bononiensis]MBL7480905.1 disulfide bond formation protein B [Legionella bononiensis]MBL7525913.1 disulfide bond formation protein B [Legionella bononiensis]MBL7564020.1 disulfide bond formation protein B [Legionella bononiensis]